MKSLGGTNITDKVLRTLLLGKMPESIKNILVVSNENLDNLSIMADKIFEMNSTTKIYSAAADNSVMNTVLDKISNLEKQISELNVHRQSRSKYRHSGFIEATADVIHERNIIPMDHTVTITLNLVINVILINVKAHVAGKRRKTPTSSRIDGKFCCR
ncbi:hypothetical protein AVEN_38807-1 [Araneus ventricosus]|uniref:Uncharacterized protein n=1 Tax=Araneus ventricosus TaxID=182803 RepID=A0A4Y2QND8_ARAVE|nr:hypothetical protein AVEN_38807-1 [Araneus ventricosus]